MWSKTLEVLNPYEALLESKSETMKDYISISEFVQMVEFAERKYPNAKVISIGTGCNDGKWYYIIFLDVDGKEVHCTIPKNI